MVFDNTNQNTAAAANKFDDGVAGKLQADANINKAFMQNDKTATLNSSGGHGDGCGCSSCAGQKLAMDAHKPGCACSGCSGAKLIQA